MAATRKARIAPTPSGYLHEGNLANFLLNARLAGPGGDLLLRVDDLDRARYRPEYLEDIFRVMIELGITVTEGPTTVADFEENWSQSHREIHYRQALKELEEHPAVFPCPCSRTALLLGHRPRCLAGDVSFDDPNVAWRVRTELFAPVVFADLARPEPWKIILHEYIPDFAVRLKSGRPSYQLACVLDDLQYGITHVGRGQDLLGSTAAQLTLSRMLGLNLQQTNYLHHPLIQDDSGRKLSKSAGSGGNGVAITESLVSSLDKLVDTWLDPSS